MEEGKKMMMKKKKKKGFEGEELGTRRDCLRWRRKKRGTGERGCCWRRLWRVKRKKWWRNRRQGSPGREGAEEQASVALRAGERRTPPQAGRS